MSTLFLRRRCVDSFVPGSLHTVCKKQVNGCRCELQTYQALMSDPLRDVVPRFYCEFQQDNERQFAACSIQYNTIITFVERYLRSVQER